MSNYLDDLATVEQAAALLHCTPAAVRDRIRRGQLKGYRPSPRVTYLKWSEIEAYIGDSSTTFQENKIED